jgi:hypothetical protein
LIMETAENREENPPKVSHEFSITLHDRFTKRLRDLAQKRQEVIRAEIPKREKTRAVIFARKNVQDCDDMFMRELRILAGLGKLQEFEPLMSLASKLQEARDELGPLEEDSFDLDQEWEWEATELAEAEEDIYDEFHEEFQEAAGRPPRSLSSSSNSHQGLPDIANDYLGDQFEDHKEDIRYGGIPTDSSVAHEDIRSTPSEATYKHQIADIDLRSDDAPVSASISPNYDARLGPFQVDRHTSGPDIEAIEPALAPIQGNQEGSDSEILPWEELNYQPEDSVTGDSLTARQKIGIWLIESTVVSKWDAYSIKWSFIVGNEKKVPSWVILVVYLVHHNHMPAVYHQRSAEEISLSLPHLPTSTKSESKPDTQIIGFKPSCSVPTPPISVMSFDLRYALNSTELPQNQKIARATQREEQHVSGDLLARNNSFNSFSGPDFVNRACAEGSVAHKLDPHEVFRPQAGSLLSNYPSLCSLQRTNATAEESYRICASPTTSYHSYDILDINKDHQLENFIESSQLDPSEEDLRVIADRVRSSTCACICHKRNSGTSEHIIQNSSTVKNQTKQYKMPMKGDNSSLTLHHLTVQKLTQAVIYDEDHKMHKQPPRPFNGLTEVLEDESTQINGSVGIGNDTPQSFVVTADTKPLILRHASEPHLLPARASNSMKESLGQKPHQKMLTNLRTRLFNTPFFTIHSHQSDPEKRQSRKIHRPRKPQSILDEKIGLRRLSTANEEKKRQHENTEGRV